MRYYETLYLINPNLSEEAYQDTLTKFSDLVDKNNGVVVKVDEWGKKSLAYQVKKFDKGFYVLLLYCGGPGITEELERAMRLDERVIKFQTVNHLCKIICEDTLKNKTLTSIPRTILQIFYG